jgi:glycosyltransferase involved in cell wall biosynthesis
MARAEKTIHVCIVNVSPRVFGAEKSLAYLVSYLRDGRFEFSLLSPGGATESLFSRYGVKRAYQLPLRRMTRTRNPMAWLAQFLRWLGTNLLVFRSLVRTRPDVVHANGVQSALAACVPAFLLRIPLVFHARDGERPRWVFRGCGVLSRAILVPGSFLRPKRGILRRRTFTALNPIVPKGGEAIESSPPVDRDEQGGRPATEPASADNAPFTIGLIGQMIPRKGHHVLLDALPRLIEETPGARVWFVGEDRFRPRSGYATALRRRVESSPALKGRVSFLGYRDDVADVYRQLDLVAAPSLEEPFGRVALEAMRFGCPVVAARVGGLGRVVEHEGNGLLFPRGDAAELARCIARIAAAPDLRERLIEGGRETARVYTCLAERDAAKTAELYAALAGTGKRPAAQARFLRKAANR